MTECNAFSSTMPSKSHAYALQYMQTKSDEYLTHLLQRYPHDMWTRSIMLSGWNRRLGIGRGETSSMESTTRCLYMGLDDLKGNVSLDDLHLRLLAGLAHIAAQGQAGHLFQSILIRFLTIAIEDLGWEVEMTCGACQAFGMCDLDMCPRCNWKTAPWECVDAKPVQGTIVTVRCEYRNTRGIVPLNFGSGTYRTTEANYLRDIPPPAKVCSLIETVETFPPYTGQRMHWQILSTTKEPHQGDTIEYDPRECASPMGCWALLLSRNNNQKGHQKYPIRLKLVNDVDAILKDVSCAGLGMDASAKAQCCGLKKTRNMTDAACLTLDVIPQAKAPGGWM
jgi:hypothetical protein